MRTRLSMASREEDAVMLRAELCEIGFGRRRIGHEVETVSGLPGRRDGDGNLGRTLEEVAAELISRVAESFYAARDAAPLDSQRIDDGAEDAERMRRVEAVGNREHVKHRADVAHVQMCCPAGDVHVSAIGGVFSAPKEERAGRDPWV